MSIYCVQLSSVDQYPETGEVTWSETHDGDWISNKNIDLQCYSGFKGSDSTDKIWCFRPTLCTLVWLNLAVEIVFYVCTHGWAVVICHISELNKIDTRTVISIIKLLCVLIYGECGNSTEFQHNGCDLNYPPPHN